MGAGSSALSLLTLLALLTRPAAAARGAALVPAEWLTYAPGGASDQWVLGVMQVSAFLALVWRFADLGWARRLATRGLAAILETGFALWGMRSVASGRHLPDFYRRMIARVHAFADGLQGHSGEFFRAALARVCRERFKYVRMGHVFLSDRRLAEVKRVAVTDGTLEASVLLSGAPLSIGDTGASLGVLCSASYAQPGSLVRNHTSSSTRPTDRPVPSGSALEPFRRETRRPTRAA